MKKYFTTPVFFSLFLLFLVSNNASAWSQPKEGPKLCLYDVRPQNIYWTDNYFQPEEQETVKKYDMICSAFYTTEAAKCKENNPSVITLYNISFGGIFPRTLFGWQVADTTWDMNALFQHYYWQNYYRGVDWGYKKTDCTDVPLVWGLKYLNFTGDSPKGVWGTSTGLGFRQWVVNKAFPSIVASPQFKNNWDGIVFDTYPTVDCWNPAWRGIDVDYDKEPDDNYGYWCGFDAITGGHMWSIQKTLGMNLIINKLLQITSPRFILLYGQDALYSASKNKANGWKIENWLYQPGAAQVGSKWLRWWDGQANTTGYLEAEQRFKRFPLTAEYDSLQGWDMSILHMHLPGNMPIDKKLKAARFGLGTCMLGDGFFALSDTDEQGNYKYFEIPEMTGWKVQLPALGDVYTMPDLSYPGVDRFCRLYRGWRWDGRPWPVTVVVDTLNQDAYLFRYNYGPSRW